MAEPRPPEKPSGPPPPSAPDAGSAPERPAAPSSGSQSDVLKPEEREIGATVLAEAAPDGTQDEKIAWAYRTFVASEGTKALQRSSAFSQKNELFRTWMVALGDKKFENDKIEHDKNFVGKSIKEYVNSPYFRGQPQKRANSMVSTLQSSRDLSKSPIAGVTNQGSAGFNSGSDINRDDQPWKNARQFLWLKRCEELKEQPAGFALEILSAKNPLYQTVLFNDTLIEGYFKKHPEQVHEKVEKFTAESNQHPPCTKQTPSKPSKEQKPKQ